MKHLVICTLASLEVSLEAFPQPKRAKAEVPIRAVVRIADISLLVNTFFILIKPFF